MRSSLMLWREPRRSHRSTPLSLWRLVLLLATMLDEAAVAQEATRHVYHLEHAASAVRVDGILDEEAWAGSTAVELPYEIFPGDNVPSPVKTECLLTYDATALYVAFRAYDQAPAGIRAHYAERDSQLLLDGDDHVGILLDTFADERRAYELRVNPLGVQVDGMWNEIGQSGDLSIDLVWTSAAHITEDGYVVELALPFRQLRMSDVGDGSWGFEAFRSWPRTVPHRLLSHRRDRDRSCVLCQADRLSLNAGKVRDHDLDLNPTLTALAADTQPDFPEGALRPDTRKLDPGLNLRWGIRPNLNLNVTLNPDFSQVEADVAQLQVNTRFALFFPEKRPFFLEGNDYFSTPIAAVFTRTVADPDFGLKLSGKVGENALGFFIAHDSVNNLLLPGNQSSEITSVDEPVWSTVLRYRRDVGSGSTLGALYTSREGDDYHNRLGGLDAFLRLSAADVLRAQLLQSYTQYPEAVGSPESPGEKTPQGRALLLRYNHDTSRWIWFLGLQELQRGFRADLGFVPRVDTITADALIAREWHREVGLWTQLDVGARTLGTWDHNGVRTDRELEIFFEGQGVLASFVNLSFSRNDYVYDGVRYPLYHGRAILNLRASSQLRLGITVHGGDTIDFDNGRAATELVIQPLLEWRPGRHIDLSLEPDLRRLDLKEGARLLAADLLQGRLVYHLGVRSFVRLIFQSTAVSRHTSLYHEPVEESERELFAQMLFSYRINPQAAILAGYTTEARELSDVPLTTTGRALFLKLSYLWTY